MAREGNNPKRRLASPTALTKDQREKLAKAAVYVGSGHHKRFPGDYGFSPPVSPRPSKSLCDGIRVILKSEAQTLLKDGVQKGMVSTHMFGEFPKYIWSVDETGEAYEAKTDPNTLGDYHGYRLEEEDAMREMIQANWKKR
ncbi:hypothetical protein QWJ07_22260 [Frankia sp. RB7]|nr:hypothetical protein [Frankia sp. RB7]